MSLLMNIAHVLPSHFLLSNVSTSCLPSLQKRDAQSCNSELLIFRKEVLFPQFKFVSYFKVKSVFLN